MAGRQIDREPPDAARAVRRSTCHKRSSTILVRIALGEFIGQPRDAELALGDRAALAILGDSRPALRALRATAS
jgi:hypothetical protein